MPAYLSPNWEYGELDRYLDDFKRVFLVCGGSFSRLAVGRHLQALEEQGDIVLVQFSGFSPNPQWEDIEKGITCFQTSGCGLIAAAGGGSAIDTAKCIRHSSGCGVPLLAIPTTAGSGSEATHFAVVYRDGVKKSVDCGLPDAVLLDSSALDTLPDYQRKATMLDALCHAVESFWSINATPESVAYSKQALRQIMDSYQGYLDNDSAGNAGMLRAAHAAGQAINIARTTAGHAMCYQLTKLYGFAHGHAAALCVGSVWPYLLAHTDRCADPRGRAYLENTLWEIGQTMGCADARGGVERFQSLLNTLHLETPAYSQEKLAALAAGINTERLDNFPVSLDSRALHALYRGIMHKKD